MLRQIALIFLSTLICPSAARAQVPMETQIQIVKAEDARRYDAVLENLMKSSTADVRKRAALAAGRIGKEDAIPTLVRLLETDKSADVRTMAAFALGEVESIKAADAILSAIKKPETGATLARLLEAAGKIAAANPKDERSKHLGAAVLGVLNAELSKQSAPDTDVIRLGLTAVLRARPAGSEETVRKFLAFTDPNIVADALNTLARLRAKNANRDARDLLATSVNAVVRANAARALGAAEDKEAVDVLIKAATSDGDQRVRVSAIRALASVKDPKAGSPLLQRGEALLASYRSKKTGAIPKEQNELLEILSAAPRIVATQNEGWANLFQEFVKYDQFRSSEVYVANEQKSTDHIDQKGLSSSKLDVKPSDWRQYSTMAQMYGAAAKFEPVSDEQKRIRKLAPGLLISLGTIEPKPNPKLVKAGPDVLRAFAAFKTDELDAVLREQLVSSDVFLRATAAELLAENSPSQGTRISIETAFKKSLTTDKQYDDAQLAMLDAMAKINKAASLDTIYLALDAPDYLVRKKALDLLDDPELFNKNPNVQSVLTLAKEKHQDEVRQYDPASGTKLGQVLNTDADYRRALSRKNGRVKAVVTTQKGTFTIDLLPEEAPLTVDNFVKLARSNYFNGLEVHRVVPNFVMQDGDPRGDGNGSPGWSIRCEINMVPYERGAVGMALSGKDTGGSQWFVTHSRQPHLDGGYTVFGRVNETGMKVVDNIVRGDKIVSVTILENVNRRDAKTPRKTSGRAKMR